MSLKIYVTNLEAYNSGHLVGGWLDLTEFDDGAEIGEAIKKITKGADEYAIHDHEGLGPFYSEHLNGDDLYNIVESFHECARLGIEWDLFCEWCDDCGYDMDDHSSFKDAFVGEYDTFRDYAEQFLDELYLHDVPESIRYYIDYDAFARDLAFDHTCIETNCKVSGRMVAVFRNN